MGSGVRNLFKYSKYYSGEEPEFIEDDVFRIVVPLNDYYLDADIENPTQSATQSATQTTQNPTQLATQTTQSDIWSGIQVPCVAEEVGYGGNYGAKVNEEQDIMRLLEHFPQLSQKQIAERLMMNINTVKYYIRKMQKAGKIEHVGSTRKGKWIVKGQLYHTTDADEKGDYAHAKK